MVSRGVVDPGNYIADEQRGGVGSGGGGGEHLLVIFSVVVAGVEGHAVLLGDGGVEGALHIVDGLGDEVETWGFVSILFRFDRLLSAFSYTSAIHLRAHFQSCTNRWLTHIIPEIRRCLPDSLTITQLPKS